MSDKKIDRRSALKMGFATLAGTGAACSAANKTLTPKQTPGPFFPNKPQKDVDMDLTHIEGNKEKAKGEVLYISGKVIDQNGDPVVGAIVDVWQADVNGRYHHERDDNPAKLDENFQGWGQLKTDKDGKYSFKTIRPGKYPGRTPHIHYKVAKRGYIELTTQLYFADEAAQNKKDFLYKRLKGQQKLVTIAFVDGPKDDPKSKSGTFDIIIEKI